MSTTISRRPSYPLGLAQAKGRNARLRELINSDELIMAPGCFDCLTARLVADAGFPAAYITGSGVSMSALGAPDIGVISFAEVAERARRIADVVEIPIICDVDTGYGGPLNVIRTVRELERAGVSAMQIEDQAWPKKCGHELGRKIVDIHEMEGRIKAAVDARDDEDVMIIARTDARTRTWPYRSTRPRHGLSRSWSRHHLRRVTGESRRNGADQPASAVPHPRQHGGRWPYPLSRRESPQRSGLPTCYLSQLTDTAIRFARRKAPRQPR